MYSKRYQFSRKTSSRAYHVRKIGKFTMRFSRQLRHNQFKIPDNYKPMNVEHLKYLMKILKKPIKVWSNGQIVYSCGNSLKTPSIKVEYVENHPKSKDSSRVKIGHFTLKYGQDASTGKTWPNDCLLQVISTQCGIQPDRLRKEITRNLRKLKGSCRWKNHSGLPRVSPVYSSDIIGGARYNGESASDAKRVLDQSQKGKSHPDMKAGHPRGHASYPKATGSEESVENYSKSGIKTGFLSRSDQDFVAHYVLKHNDSKDAMELLNYRGKKGLREVVKIPAKYLWIDESKLPKVQEWENGKKIGEPGRMNKVVVVMKHFHEKYDDDEADVFILTLYPTL